MTDRQPQNKLPIRSQPLLQAPALTDWNPPAWLDQLQFAFWHVVHHTTEHPGVASTHPPGRHSSEGPQPSTAHMQPGSQTAASAGSSRLVCQACLIPTAGNGSAAALIAGITLGAVCWPLFGAWQCQLCHHLHQGSSTSAQGLPAGITRQQS